MMKKINELLAMMGTNHYGFGIACSTLAIQKSLNTGQNMGSLKCDKLILLNWFASKECIFSLISPILQYIYDKLKILMKG